MFPEIRRVEPVRGYVLRLEFNDGAVRDIDLSDELHGEVFAPLRDPGFFSEVAVNPDTGTIEWPNGADFAPEFLAVYHHPAHAWNVDRMLDAMQASLDYYTAHFGPYQFDHARIVEFPGYQNFAQAFAGTIPYSETVGFISHYDAPETIDYVTFLTAHELAHQYWAHQIVGADVEGREVLSETLAQYSAMMVAKRLYGEDGVRRALQFQLDQYLAGRSYLGDEEPPLGRVDGLDYITYRKGAVVMYLLQKRLGEDAVNRALRSLLAR